MVRPDNTRAIATADRLGMSRLSDTATIDEQHRHLYRIRLDVTRQALATVLPMTKVERPGWGHRVHVEAAEGWVLTEQGRTVAVSRFRRPLPDVTLTEQELTHVRRMLTEMLSF